MQKNSIQSISNWAHSLYIFDSVEIDSRLDDILLRLVMMDAGPEFELSYKKLENIADKLIADEDVTL